jgi:hypothetical protein
MFSFLSIIVFISRYRSAEVVHVVSVTHKETLSIKNSEDINVNTDEFCSCDKTLWISSRFVRCK